MEPPMKQVHPHHNPMAPTVCWKCMECITTFSPNATHAVCWMCIWSAYHHILIQWRSCSAGSAFGVHITTFSPNGTRVIPLHQSPSNQRLIRHQKSMTRAVVIAAAAITTTTIRLDSRGIAPEAPPPHPAGTRHSPSHPACARQCVRARRLTRIACRLLEQRRQPSRRHLRVRPCRQSGLGKVVKV